MHSFANAAVGVLAVFLVYPFVKSTIFGLKVAYCWIRPGPERAVNDSDELVVFEEECRDRAVRLRKEEAESQDTEGE